MRLAELSSSKLQSLPKILRTMLACRKRVEVNFDFCLRLDGMVIDIGWFELPCTDGFRNSQKECGRSVERPNVNDPPTLVYRGLHCNAPIAGIAGHLRIYADGELTQRNFLAPMPEPMPATNPDGPLYAHRCRRSLNHSFARKIHVGITA